MRLLPSLVFLSGLAVTFGAFADDWPQWLGPRRDGVWRETGIAETFPAAGPKVNWRVPVGAGYSGPAVAVGKVYLTDRRLKPGAANPANPFDRGAIPGFERVLCLDEKTGATLWSKEYDCPYNMSYPAGPRATPLVDGGKVYTLGAEGNLLCLDAEKGGEIWSRDFKKDFNIPTPLWGFAAHPLIDGDKLICLVGGQGSVVVAFDKRTGKELWRALSAKEPGYCPPTLIETDGQKQLIVWHPEGLNALKPDSGEVIWSEPFPSQMGLSVSTPRFADGSLFVTAFYNGSKMFDISSGKPKVMWKSSKVSERETDGLHSIMPTPFVVDGYVYGVCSYGQLRCLNAKTGERVWETLLATTANGKETRWANAFLTPQGDRFFLFNELGDLIIAYLSPKGYREISRAHILEPTNTAAGRNVVWSHPAYANGSALVRNDKELVSVNLRQ